MSPKQKRRQWEICAVEYALEAAGGVRGDDVRSDVRVFGCHREPGVHHSASYAIEQAGLIRSGIQRLNHWEGYASFTTRFG